MKPTLSFNEADHTYYLGDKHLPSVTKILNQWHKVNGVYYNVNTRQSVPDYIFEAAGDRGRAVHKILELLLTGQGVNTAALDPSLLPYIATIKKFIGNYAPQPEIVEKPLCDEKRGYAGTLDFYGKVKGIKNKIIFDCKTGAEGPTDKQTAAYENLVRIETGYRGLIDRYLLRILPDRYYFWQIGTATDFQYFLLKLKIYQLEGGNK